MPLLAISPAKAGLGNFAEVVSRLIAYDTQPILAPRPCDGRDHFPNVLMNEIEETLMIKKSLLNLAVDLLIPYGEGVDRLELLLGEGVYLLVDVEPVAVVVVQYLLAYLGIRCQQVQFYQGLGDGLGYQKLIHPEKQQVDVIAPEVKQGLEQPDQLVAHVTLRVGVLLPADRGLLYLELLAVVRHVQVDELIGQEFLGYDKSTCKYNSDT